MDPVLYGCWLFLCVDPVLYFCCFCVWTLYCSWGWTLYCTVADCFCVWTLYFTVADCFCVWTLYCCWLFLCVDPVLLLTVSVCRPCTVADSSCVCGPCTVLLLTVCGPCTVAVSGCGPCTVAVSVCGPWTVLLLTVSVCGPCTVADPVMSWQSACFTWQGQCNDKRHDFTLLFLLVIHVTRNCFGCFCHTNNWELFWLVVSVTQVTGNCFDWLFCHTSNWELFWLVISVTSNWEWFWLVISVTSNWEWFWLVISVTQVTGNGFDWLFLSHREDRIVLSDCFSCRSSWKLFWWMVFVMQITGLVVSFQHVRGNNYSQWKCSCLFPVSCLYLHLFFSSDNCFCFDIVIRSCLLVTSLPGLRTHWHLLLCWRGLSFYLLYNSLDHACDLNQYCFTSVLHVVLDFQITCEEALKCVLTVCNGTEMCRCFYPQGVLGLRAVHTTQSVPGCMEHN